MKKTIYLKSSFGIHAYESFNWQQWGDMYEEVSWLQYILSKFF